MGEREGQGWAGLGCPLLAWMFLFSRGTNLRYLVRKDDHSSNSARHFRLPQVFLPNCCVRLPLCQARNRHVRPPLENKAFEV